MKNSHVSVKQPKQKRPQRRCRHG